jgi:hypothetical protein
VPLASIRFLAAVFLALTSLSRADFLSDVRPVLKARCFSCHSALKAEAGLRLDSVSAMHMGGDSGSILANHAGILLDRITSSDEADRMPPEGAPLTPAQIDAFRAWIAAGSPAPVPDEPEPDPRSHWAFQLPQPSPLPEVPPPWNGNAIDRLLASHHTKQGLQPQEPTKPELWLRRVSFDLTGLPPTPAQVAAFLADHAPDARSRAVDQLLSSPQFGERWARHFMDLWRYADWWGLDQQLRYSQKHIWHWRDWIVESLNGNHGLNRMITEMLAADELAPDDPATLRATGFLCRPYYLFNRTTWLDEVVEHTSRAFLGLTMQCVKCHDHKYDPLSHTDYYRFRAIFEPYHVRVDAWPDELDFEKNGLARAFDLHTERPTYLHRRGDEKLADTSKAHQSHCRPPPVTLARFRTWPPATARLRKQKSPPSPPAETSRNDSPQLRSARTSSTPSTGPIPPKRASIRTLPPSPPMPPDSKPHGRWPRPPLAQQNQPNRPPPLPQTKKRNSANSRTLPWRPS